MTRKKYILSLESRTPDQAAEEEALYVEVKRLEHTEKKFKKERENLLRILAGIDSGLADIVEDDVSLVGAQSNEIKSLPKTLKKKGGTADIDSPSTPSASVASAIKRPNTAKNAAYGSLLPFFQLYFLVIHMPFTDAQHCIVRTDPPTTGVATKAAHHPAYLRSFKLPTPKAAIAPKITQALAELGISHSRLVMPTRENIGQLESLLEATTALVETKRVVDKVEYDIQVLKNRLGMQENSQTDGDTEMKTEGGDEDESRPGGEGENEETEDGRAQSVVSAPGGRNRKHVSTIFMFTGHSFLTFGIGFRLAARCLSRLWTQSQLEQARNDRREAKARLGKAFPMECIWQVQKLLNRYMLNVDRTDVHGKSLVYIAKINAVVNTKRLQK